MKVIENNQTAITLLCQSHKVASLYAFGSVTNNSFDKDKESDLDFYLTMQPNIPPIENGEYILDLWLNFEKLFNRKVDLITDKSVKNQYFLAQIEKTKVKIYG